MCYYPSNNSSWSDTPADPPEGMGDGASMVWTGGDSLYVLRGEFEESSPLYDFWRYNISSSNWASMADIPASNHSGGSGGVGEGGSLIYVGFWFPDQMDYIYALSGNQAHPDNIPDNRTYRYTISQDSWSRFEDLPFGVRYYVGCRFAYANGSIHAWQGAPSTWTNGGDDLACYVIPEFALMFPLAVFMITTLLVAVAYGRKQSWASLAGIHERGKANHNYFAYQYVNA